MWAAIKRFFGFGQSETVVVEPTENRVPKASKPEYSLPEVGDIPVMPTGIPPAPQPIQKKRHTRKNVVKSKYYRRGGDYYDIEDDSLIMDLALVVILSEMFTAEEDWDFVETPEDAVVAGVVEAYDSDEIAIAAAEVEPETTVSDIDAAVAEVAASIPDPAPVVDTEPTYNSYSGGSSSSTYSGGSSYSGGSDSSSSYDSGSSDSGGGSDD